MATRLRRPERVAYCHSFGGSASRKKSLMQQKNWRLRRLPQHAVFRYAGAMSKEPDEKEPTARERAVAAAKEQREARAAKKLRENLLRRKQQVRARRAGEADDAVGLPAAKSTQDDD
ncbi:hypothetical protein [Ciceribacter sp. L1K22]|uniref:hypothetical protein n=1 Tax=Ciceribacter sp. L1K22 TaxID=2820275 RepID=UPI001FEFC3F5|nr:hypothetical protein [Ciceribacter sp. L1K22]